MKKLLATFLLLTISSLVFAQKKTVQIEAGINYPIGLKKDGNKENQDRKSVV